MATKRSWTNILSQGFESLENREQFFTLVLLFLSSVMHIVVVTVSDSAKKGLRTDASGPALRSLIESSTKLGEVVVEDALLADEKDEIVRLLFECCERADVIITTGGTGFAPRDVTPEAVLSVIEKRCGGLETALHQRSLQATPFAALSRLCAGIRNRTLIVALPGSTKAVKECFEVLEGVLLHAVQLIKDEHSHTHEHCSLHKPA